MQGVAAPATMFALEHEWSKERVALALDVTPNQVCKYVGGFRRVNPSQKTAMLREFGEAAYEWVELCDASWRVKRETPKIEREHVEPRRDAVNPADPDWDGTTYTIDEWKRLFGEPGGAVDEHGRIIGFRPCFTTEPDFCD